MNLFGSISDNLCPASKKERVAWSIRRVEVFQKFEDAEVLVTGYSDTWERASELMLAKIKELKAPSKPGENYKVVSVNHYHYICGGGRLEEKIIHEKLTHSQAKTLAAMENNATRMGRGDGRFYLSLESGTTVSE
jgi:hypothetical protein